VMSGHFVLSPCETQIVTVSVMYIIIYNDGTTSSTDNRKHGHQFIEDS